MPTPRTRSTHIAVAIIIATLWSGLVHAQFPIIDSAGDGTNGLLFPAEIVVDGASNTFVAGAGTHNVLKITNGGAITQIIDGTGDGTNPLRNPFALALDDLGSVYVAGQTTHNVFKITPDGTITQIIDATGDGIHPLDTPFGLAVDDKNNVYVAGAFSDNVFRVEPTGTITQIIDATGDGTNPLDTPIGVAVNGSGRVFVAGQESDNVFLIPPGGSISQIIDATGDGVATLDVAARLLPSSGNGVYVTGGESDNVFHITSGGAITLVVDAAGDGTTGLDRPSGLVLDSNGDLLVSSANTDSVFRVDSGTGTVTRVLASGEGGAVFASPLSLAIDPLDNLYVPGNGSHNVVRMGSLTGTCADPATIDYRGFAAAECSSRSVSVIDQAELDAYHLDFGVDADGPSNLDIDFNPAGDIEIVSPCQVRLHGAAEGLVVRAPNLCIFGRAGVDVGRGSTEPGNGIETSGPILLTAEEGDATTRPGLDLGGQDLTLIAGNTARLGDHTRVATTETVTLRSLDTTGVGDALIGRECTIATGDTNVAASNRTIVRQDADIVSRGDITIGSTSGVRTASATLSRDVTLIAFGRVDLRAVKTRIGRNVRITSNETIRLAAEGDPSRSEGRLDSSANLAARDLRLTSDNRLDLALGVQMAIAGTAEVDAVGECAVHPTVTVDAGAIEGACLDP